MQKYPPADDESHDKLMKSELLTNHTHICVCVEGELPLTIANFSPHCIYWSREADAGLKASAKAVGYASEST
jgi:hypothetical protein